MSRRALSLSAVSTLLALPLIVNCSGTTEPGDDDVGATGGASSGGATMTGGTATGGAVTGGSATGGSATGGSATGGSAIGGTATGGNATGGSITGGSAGISGSGGSLTGGSGGATNGGSAGSGAAGGSGGAGKGFGGSITGGSGGSPPLPPLNCGGKGTVVENAGPHTNRLNYVIAGDGYSEADLQPNGALDRHIQAAMTKRFSDPIGQPYLRYRKFVNICVIRIPSTPICGSSALGCCGSDSSRLANCNTSAANSAITSNVPSTLEVDWRAVVLNGSSWWNSGGTLMLWSGGNRDAGGAAAHEGGHGHHFISDEYDACEQGRVSREMTYGV
ncbi:MAG TPA: hypothetical protein VFZ53_07020, partial [Polyangiaceae bacterium]